MRHRAAVLHRPGDGLDHCPRRRVAQQRVTILATDIYKGFPTDGVIGYSLLRHYAVELDYDRNRMILYEPSTFSPGEGWTSIDIYFKGNRIPWTDLSVATAKEAPVRLSTYIDLAWGAALELLERKTNVLFNVIFDYVHHKFHLRPNRRFAEPFQ